MKTQVCTARNEVQNLSFVKTILMLLVVLDHSMAFWTGGWFTKNPVFQAELFAVLSSFLGSFHTYGFALASGYLFYYLKYEEGKYVNYLPFVKQKAKRLIIPFVFVAVFWVIPITYLFAPFGLKELVNRYILGVSPGQLWFLLMLFGLFSLFYLLADLIKEHQILGTVLVAGIYCAGIIGQVFLPNLFQILRACIYLPVFWVGFKLRQWGSEFLRRFPSWLWVLAHILLFLLLRYLTLFDGAVFTLLCMGMELVLRVVGAVTAFVVLQRIADKLKWKNSKVFGSLSKYAMPIYLFHQQVIYISIYLLNGLLNPYVHAIINFAVAMTVSVIISMFLMRFRLTRFLIGEK